MNARPLRSLRATGLLVVAVAACAAAAEPRDPYEVREDCENVLAAPSSTAPTLTLGTPFVQSATGWLLPGTDIASLLPEFRLTLDASMPGGDATASTSSGNALGSLERRVKGVEFLVPQTRTLWLGWEQPDTEGDSPRTTFSIRNSF